MQIWNSEDEYFCEMAVSKELYVKKALMTFFLTSFLFAIETGAS